MKFPIFSLIPLIALLLSACSGPAGPKIEIQDPWVRAAAVMIAEGKDDDTGSMAGGDEMPGHQGSGSNSAAYMVIKNSGGEADRMLSAEADVAEAVELHISEMKEEVMTMHQVDGVDIPARGQAELKPGGLHVMLIGLKHELNAGDVLRLTLNFEKSGTLSVDAQVRMP